MNLATNAFQALGEGGGNISIRLSRMTLDCDDTQLGNLAPGIYSRLCIEDDGPLLYLMAIARKNEIKKGVSLYVTELRKAKPQITGRDLKAMGYSPGPRFKTALNELLTAHLDGVVQSRLEEETFIQQHFPLDEGLPDHNKTTLQ